ncbi:MAG TPA: protein kinase [Thermoanaerobaculia bacterium]|nr:protein kinase [Thermoanaerobaculia bacterium]
MSDPSGKIGPYQILERLGAGGMGEVFLAYDERLDRKVAIKRIRLEKGSDPDRRERFRREARIAARLNHPAIVHIYDVQADGESDCIVMEHVEGEDLRHLLRRGPLSVGQTVAIAGDIASGLEEAHRQGIIHRDLKTENVLITPSGRGKIADFGIAKRMFLEEDERALTMDGHVLGTSRSMSPEQARGEPVDHRSDLFSFGVLLYESLTGRSPFEAENELATLQKIVHHRQAPVRERRREVPEELSALIDQLLQKDPRLRPRNAGEVVRALQKIQDSIPTETLGTTIAEPVSWAPPVQEEPRPMDSGLTGSPRLRMRMLAFALLLIVLAGAGIYVYKTFLRDEKPLLYVAVMPPEIVSGGGTETADLLSLAVRDSLVRGLVSLQGISPKDAEDAAMDAGVDEVVRSRLYCQPESCRITLDRMRRADGSLLGSESFDVPTDDFHLIANAVANQVRHAYGDHRVREEGRSFEVNDRDFREFLRLRRQYDAREDASMESVLAGLEKLRSRAPSFFEAYLLEADALRYRFYNSRDPNDLDRAFVLIQRAREMAPEDPEPLFLLIEAAAAGNRPDLMEDAIKTLESLVPGDIGLLDARSRLFAVQGKPEEALSILREAVKRHPSAKRLFSLAQLEIQQGQIADARIHAEELLRRSPDHLDGLSMLAGIELLNGNPTRAADLYAKIVRRSPGLPELSNLAFAYFLLGRFEDSARVYERILEQEPRNPLFNFNLADTRFLTGRKKEAEALYLRALDLLPEDPAASTPQFQSVKAQALAHLGRRREAAAAVQEALRLAPNDGFIAFEASLVYTLLGEDDSALVNVERALQLGIHKSWFSVPWFLPLKDHPDFQRLTGR